MPELPEVQTVVNGLKSKIINRKILRLRNNIKKLRYPIQKNLASITEGNVVMNVTRKAKYIVINLSNNQSLIMHLGMSGRIILKKNDNIVFKHTHISIYFSSNCILQFIDPRRFGYIFITSTKKIESHRFFKNLGVEPLSNTFDSNYLFNILKNKISSIKHIIMNQKYIVGIGNIYAAEALFNSGISPMRPGNTISSLECKKLVKAIKYVLEKSIKMGGSSINDHTMVTGKIGYYQNKLKVYGRSGLKCTKKSCSSVIIRIIISQRSTFYCSKCQI